MIDILGILQNNRKIIDIPIFVYHILHFLGKMTINNMILHYVYNKLKFRYIQSNKAIVIKHQGKNSHIFHKRLVHKQGTLYLLDLDLKFIIANNHTHSLAFR